MLPSVLNLFPDHFGAILREIVHAAPPVLLLKLSFLLSLENVALLIEYSYLRLREQEYSTWYRSTVYFRRSFPCYHSLVKQRWRLSDEIKELFFISLLRLSIGNTQSIWKFAGNKAERNETLKNAFQARKRVNNAMNCKASRVRINIFEILVNYFLQIYENT